VASVIQKVLAEHGNPDDSIGHIGGDDFAMLTTPDRAEPICRALIGTFDEEVRQLYNPEDQQRGYISGADRYGILRRFGLLSISIGVVTTQRRGFSDHESLTRVAAEMKHHAKEQPGSSYAVDQRTMPHANEVECRRARRRALMILSEDSSLRATLRSTFHDGGYNVYESASVDHARQKLAALEPPALILADAQVGGALWDLCAERAGNQHSMPIVVLAYDTQDIEQARVAGATCLQLPLPLVEILACVEQLISKSDATEPACVQ
jgi:GGDEF domain-containing protein